MAGPMNGVRVLDLGAMIAGPMAATILCDQGADVIKVEPPGIGDLMRHFGATCNGIGGVYHSANRGKRSLALNLKSVEGVALVKELAADTDVVVHNLTDLPNHPQMKENQSFATLEHPEAGVVD